MKKLFLIPLFSLALSGCATLPQVTTTIGAVQQAAVIACGFLPTVSTVAGILSGGNAAVLTAEAIATAICSAVHPAQSGRLGARRMTVNGVPIRGRFVR